MIGARLLMHGGEVWLFEVLDARNKIVVNALLVINSTSSCTSGTFGTDCIQKWGTFN